MQGHLDHGREFDIDLDLGAGAGAGLDGHLGVDLENMGRGELALGSQIQIQMQKQQQQQQLSTQQSHAQQLREDAVRRGENIQKGPKLERSPHPYHKRCEEIPFGSERMPEVGRGGSRGGSSRADRPPPILGARPSSINPSVSPALPSPLRLAQNSSDDLYTGVRIVVDGSLGGYVESTNSDSGTEADDEHFLKGLPAPRMKPHKGLRGENGGMSSTPSPLLSPTILDEEMRWKEGGRGRSAALASRVLSGEEQRRVIEKFRRRRRIEIIRRTTEALLLCFVGGIIYRSQGVKEILYLWRNELACQILIISGLIALYPLRLLRHLSSRTPWKSPFPLTIPATFDPAPLLYPPTLTMLISILLSVSDPSGLLPSMILAISTLPKKLIPAIGGLEGRDMLHWVLACLPLFTTTLTRAPLSSKESLPLNPEVLVLIPPLHQALCTTLHYLTTTSLLSAELQLLSTSLISLLLRASSPQAVILKALLWGGGIGILVTCTHVFKWGVALARVPKWRFRRPGSKKSGFRLNRSLSFGSNTLSVFAKDTFISDTSDEEYLRDRSGRKGGKFQAAHFSLADGESQTGISRRNTLPTSTPSSPSNAMKKTTPSGRKKRSSSLSLQSFSKLTYTEATIRKWLYAVYVYVCIFVIILLGIREYVGRQALQHYEPIGWALAYLFGDLPRFRFEVVSANLQRWIPLPPRLSTDPNIPEPAACKQKGWIERIRSSDFGPANTRLILSTYWLLIIITGLAIVFRLSRIYEVDTRRKVFHFMMVAMLFPATYIDPTYCALALSLVLAIFLLLDLIRATQMPPFSRHLARFLTPYVDGRDLKGPVVISHIFLLIGCAVPLWLSLGSIARVGGRFHEDGGRDIDRDGDGDALAGWEVQKRETAMVAGVICVGLGDAAASLVGRRYGRRKWVWVGGKSVEGSVAFGVVVAVALVVARGWLRGGGWDGLGGDREESHHYYSYVGRDADADVYVNADTWHMTVGKSILAAGVASLTEAVLTGGNDNVVVPVVLWCCVRGLRI